MIDLISRQAVKDWLLRWEGYIDKDTIARMQYRVIDIPSVEVEPVKHGEWRDYPIADGCLQCSICGVLRIGGPSNFCPNCGAKMNLAEDVE